MSEDEKLKKSLQRLYRDYLVDDGSLAELDRYELSRAERERVVQIIRELRSRGTESLSLYRPLSHLAGFHSCLAPELIARGSNRGGKTVVAAVEFARAVTGQDPFHKYPVRDGRALICGKDGRHNAEVIYRKLFRFGAFKIIEKQRAGSGKWEAFNPTNPAHLAREKEAKPAPPLIPPRFIKSIAWENKKESSPRLVKLTNGWEIIFASSQGKPPQGIDVDLVWFDEEISDSEWYPECTARLVDRKGRFFWSATAQLGGVQLFELCERAAKQKSLENPVVVEFFAHLDNNDHFTQQQRDLFFEKLTPEQRRIRIEGEFAFTSRLVYPEFSERTHGCKWFQIPSSWTRYMLVDPGRTVCAVLFAAVPPPSDPRHTQVFVYDQLYIQAASAAEFGRQVALKAEGQSFQAFIIDQMWGRTTDAGHGGPTLEQQYSRELKKHRVRSKDTGYGFVPGSTDVLSGIEMFRSWLFIRPDATPKFQYFRDKCPDLVWEITRYRWGKETKRGGHVMPEKLHDHLVDLLRYLAMYDPKWHRPKKRKNTQSKRHAESVRERMRKEYGDTSRGVRLGPPRTAGATR